MSRSASKKKSKNRHKNSETDKESGPLSYSKKGQTTHSRDRLTLRIQDPNLTITRRTIRRMIKKGEALVENIDEGKKKVYIKSQKLNLIMDSSMRVLVSAWHDDPEVSDMQWA